MLNKENKKIFYTYFWIGLAIGIISIFGKNSDFAVYYKSTQDFLTLGWDKVYDPSSLTPFKYHPFCLFLFVPFSVFGFTTGKILWSLFNGVLVFHVLWLLYLKYNTKISTVIIAFLILAHPLTWQLKFNNITFVMLWLLTIHIFNKDIIIKSMCLALLIVIKPFWELIPALYFLSKEYRLVFYSMLFIVVLSIIPVLFSPHIYNQWFVTLNDPVHSHNYSKTDNQCVYALFYRYIEVLKPYISYLWGLASAIFFAVWYYFRFGFSFPFIKRSLDHIDIFSSVLVILWVGPLSWFHNYLLLLPLIAILLERTQKHKYLLWGTLWFLMTGISLLPAEFKKELYFLGIPLLFLVAMLIPIPIQDSVQK